MQPPDVSGSRSSLTPGYTVSLKKQLALMQMLSALAYNLGQIKLNIPILTSDTNPWWPLALWTVVLLQSVILGQIAQFTIQDHSRVGFMHTSPTPLKYTFKPQPSCGSSNFYKNWYKRFMPCLLGVSTTYNNNGTYFFYPEQKEQKKNSKWKR